MYWPVGHVQHVRDERASSPDDTLLDLCYNRRTNLFVTYSGQSITLWSSEVSPEAGRANTVSDELLFQPTCRIVRVERTHGSLEEYGLNRLVEWSGDGHSIFVCVSTGTYERLDT